MNVFITKLNGLPMQDTAQYIQRMTAEIAHQLGFREMGIYCYNGAKESRESLNARLDGIIAGIEWGNDVVICQFPTENGFKYEWELLKRMKMYQSKVVIFIHNAESLVQEANRTVLEETLRLYNQAEVLIVPSLALRQFLLDNGIKKEIKFVIQEMWDYTTDRNYYSFPKFLKEIHFAGGNSFEGMGDWKDTIPLKTYAALVNQGRNVHDMGVLSPQELLSEFSKGGFGLVWYQDENSRRCMEYEVSFSLAQYLAAGIPVIVPVGISNQAIIEKNHLGLIVNSLEEAVETIESMTEMEYQQYIQSIGKFAQTLRNGYYTKKCLVDAIHTAYRSDMDDIAVPKKICNLGKQKFTYVVLKESYGGNFALSWSYHGNVDGFLIYDVFGKIIYETRNLHQHYFLIKGYERESRFIIKAYIDTLKGKMIVSESDQICVQEQLYDHVKASLVIPAYNAQDYIVRGMDVALAQSFSELEIVVVDDGSTDHTPEIIDWYAEKFPNIIVIHQENGGVGKARNMDIKHARGEYIGFMDCDDMLHPDMIMKLYQSAKKNCCDIAITSVYRIRESGYEIKLQYPLEENTAVTTEDFFNMLFNTEFIYSVEIWNKLYRSSLVKGHLFPELFLGEDAAWTPYILSFSERICYIDDFLYEYDRTIRPKTLADQWLNQAKNERFMMYKNIVMFYIRNGSPEKRGIMKMVAKRFLLMWSQIYNDSAYIKLCEDIDNIF